MPRQLVAKAVADEEIVVRGLLVLYSGAVPRESLKEQAFMPPPNKDDVSVLRHSYTDDDHCKRHAAKLKVNQQEYTGLAVVYSGAIRAAGKAVNNGVEVDVNYTPLDAEGNLIDLSQDVYSEDLGLPMHADIVYSEKNIKVEEEGVGNPMEKIGQISMEIIEYAKGQNDPNVSSNRWEGTPLSKMLQS